MEEKIKYYIKVIFVAIIGIIIGIATSTNNVHAENISLGEMGFAWDGNITDTPTSAYSLGAGRSLSESLVIYNYVAETYPFTFIIMEWCTTNPGMIENLYITNASYTNDYIMDGKGASYMKEPGSCNISGYEGYKVTKQLQIGKYQDFDGTGWEKVASGTMNFTNHYPYNVMYRLDSIYLSSNDYVTALEMENNAILQEKQNTQDIINNQNNNADKILNEGTFVKPEEDLEISDSEEKEEEIYDLFEGVNINAITIDFETKSVTKIFELLNRIITQNTVIQTMLITILSISIIKLVLGR